MTPQFHGRGRTLTILFLLCLTVWAQSASLAALHDQQHSTNHCCLLCHVGPVPFLQTVGTFAVAPVQPVGWLAPQPVFQAVHDVLRPARSSRAPPSV
jgi:hypothetical protein